MHTPQQATPAPRAKRATLPTTAQWSALAALFLLATPEAGAQTGDGVLGVPWGTTLGELQARYALAFTDSSGAWSRYRAGIERIGTAEVEECLLEFRGDAFCGGAVLTRGTVQTRRLLAYLHQTFGAGKKENDRACQWLTPATHLFYDEDSAGDGYIYWYSLELAGSIAGSGDRPTPLRRQPR